MSADEFYKCGGIWNKIPVDFSWFMQSNIIQNDIVMVQYAYPWLYVVADWLARNQQVCQRQRNPPGYHNADRFMGNAATKEYVVAAVTVTSK